MEILSELPQRRLGKTGVEVSLLGLGGHPVGLPALSDDDAVRLVRSAVDGGIDFLDNSPDYNEGRSEERMGMALRDGYRDRVFLMTKVNPRDREGALRELDESLRRLRTDHLDLWQLHALAEERDVDEVSAPGGALDALDEALRSGKTRFVGFTGHSSPGVHRRMLDLYPFDTVQMPLNVMDPHYESFEENVLPEAQRRGLGILAMKVFASGAILKSGVVTAAEALRYALSLPVSTAVVGLGSLDELNAALAVARSFLPLTPEERATILERTAPIAGLGTFEEYKTGSLAVPV